MNNKIQSDLSAKQQSLQVAQVKRQHAILQGERFHD